jgi:signal peptidase I
VNHDHQPEEHPVADPAQAATPEWPRMVEPESEEAWAALGITMPPAEPAPADPTTPAPNVARIKIDRRSAVMSRIGEEVFAWVKTLASAAVYATLIVTFGFQVARVEGQSMAPTLEDQDRLIVNKLAYQFDSPKQGDIVMLYYPKDPGKSFVKRVIAEPLDTVRMQDGRVYVNEVLIEDDFIPEQYQSTDNMVPELVPEGYYFVMGDHRNNSSDSRHWGMVPKKYILGRVQLRWWPFSHARFFNSEEMLPSAGNEAMRQ